MRIQAARYATIPAPTAHTSATVAMRTMTGSTSRWRAMPPQTPPSMRSSLERVIRRGVVFSVVVGESVRVSMSVWSPPGRPRTIGNRPYVPSPGEPSVAAVYTATAGAATRGSVPAAALTAPSSAADLLHDVGHRGVAADPGAQDGRVAAGVRLDVLEVVIERSREAGGRLELRVGLGERLHLVRRRADDRDVEVALAREVVVEQALRDPGGGGYVVDRDLVERPLAEDLDAERDELLAAGVGAQTGAAGGHPRRSVSRATAGSRGGAARPRRWRRAA